MCSIKKGEISIMIEYKPNIDCVDNCAIIEDVKNSKIIYINELLKEVLKINEGDTVDGIKDIISNEQVLEELKNYISKNMKSEKKISGKTCLKNYEDEYLETTFVCEWEDEEKQLLHYKFKDIEKVFSEYEIENNLEDILLDKFMNLTAEKLFKIDIKKNSIKFLGKSRFLFGDISVLEDYSNTIFESYTLHEEDADLYTDMIDNFNKGIFKPVELRFKLKGYDFRWYKITYRCIKNNNCEVAYILGKFTDITKKKLMEQKSRTDGLTGLYNNATTTSEVEKLLNFRTENTHAIFSIDIDNFKRINDGVGYHFGDMVLSSIAEDLKSCFRKDDIIGRIGGDEFVVVMRDIKDTATIIERAEIICKALNKTFCGNGKEYTTSASIGIAIYPDDGDNYDELYKKAMSALYEVKRTGKDGFRRFYDDLEYIKESFIVSDLDGRRMQPVFINNNIISTVLNLLYKTRDLDSSIETIIQYIGTMFKIDRCYIFETIDNGNSYYNNFGWCKNKDENRNKAPDIAVGDIKNILLDVNKDGIYYTSDINTIKDEVVLNTLKSVDVKSVAIISSLKNYNESMFICLEDCRIERQWSEEEIITLLHISRLIFTAINNRNIVQKMKQEALFKPKSFLCNRDENNTITTNQLSEVILDFYTEQDDAMSVIGILKDACQILNIARVTANLYSEKDQQYLNLFEYNINGEILDNSDQFEKYSYTNNAVEFENIETRASFAKLFNENNYLYSDDYNKVESELKKVGFASKNEEDIKEICVFRRSADNHQFGYMTFEKYDGDKMSDGDVALLATFCTIINSRVQKVERVEKYENDILIKDIILKNEKFPIAVVDKYTYEVLYHNNLCYNIFPSIQIGEKCDELLNEKTSVLQNVLINDSNRLDHQWIKKSVKFTLKNGNDAYLVYAKDSIDYVKQINAVDELTQSLLRRGFEEKYKNTIKNNDYSYVLCTLDIDKFKYINELFDYQTGDEILKRMARVIRGFLKEHESFCRLNDEKFAMFISYNNEMQLNHKIKTLSKKFEEMREKYFSDIKITVNMGITIVNKATHFNTLLDQSTIARSSAKGSHKNTFAYYNSEIDDKIKKEVHLEDKIPNAIANNEFVPFLQAKFDLNTKKICGAEALVRWVSSDGMVFPDQFIPLFERNGFITTLDFIVYEKVMEYIRKCLDTGLPVYTISVNVSRNHIKNENFFLDFMKLVNKYKVPLEYLELEITESVFIEDKMELKKFVQNIKKYGMKISIDDFGSAYSSLQNLTEIDVDTLKIDKGFLDNIDMTADVVTKDEILIKNIIALAKDLDFHVICEGVETEEQIEMLKRNGCEYGQGYIFARPVSLEEYEKQFLIED